MAEVKRTRSPRRGDTLELRLYYTTTWLYRHFNRFSLGIESFAKLEGLEVLKPDRPILHCHKHIIPVGTEAENVLFALHFNVHASRHIFQPFNLPRTHIAIATVWISIYQLPVRSRDLSTVKRGGYIEEGATFSDQQWPKIDPMSKQSKSFSQ